MAKQSGLKGKRSSKLLKYEGMSLRGPVGTLTGFVEVVLNVQVRLDPEDNDHSAGGEGGGYDVLRRELQACAERIHTFYENSSPRQATPAAQAELDFTLDGLKELVQHLEDDVQVPPVRGD